MHFLGYLNQFASDCICDDFWSTHTHLTIRLVSYVLAFLCQITQRDGKQGEKLNVRGHGTSHSYWLSPDGDDDDDDVTGSNE